MEEELGALRDRHDDVIPGAGATGTDNDDRRSYEGEPEKPPALPPRNEAPSKESESRLI
jgi:hypothetical protein